MAVQANIFLNDYLIKIYFDAKEPNIFISLNAYTLRIQI